MLDMEWVQELDQAIGVSARLVLALHIEMLSLRVPVVALKSGHVRRTAQKSVERGSMAMTTEARIFHLRKNPKLRFAVGTATVL